MNYSNEDVFISYSSKNHETALKIKKRLEAPPRSVSCWMANDVTISGGEDFRSRIVEAIRRCKVFLFILSAESMASEWCSLELSFAILENKKIYSIRIDDAPLTEVCSFKLGCSQISDGTVNFDAVIESLAINVKNGRDWVLEAEQKRISGSKQYGLGGYISWRIASLAFGVAILGAVIAIITQISAAGSILDLLSSSSSSRTSEITLSAMRVFLWSLFPFILSRIMLRTRLSVISSAAKADSPSALYSLYIIMTRTSLLYLLIGRRKALEHLHRSAELGYPRAVREMERLGKY